MIVTVPDDDEFQDKEDPYYESEVGSMDEGDDQQLEIEQEVSFNTAPSVKQRIKKLKNDPQYRDILDHLVEERVKQKQQKIPNSRDYKRNKHGKHGKETEGVLEKDSESQEDNDSQTMIRADIEEPSNRLIKSTSDSTLYTPALRLSADNNTALNQISNFVENITLEHSRDSSKRCTPEKTPRVASVVKKINATHIENRDKSDER